MFHLIILILIFISGCNRYFDSSKFSGANLKEKFRFNVKENNKNEKSQTKNNVKKEEIKEKVNPNVDEAPIRSWFRWIQKI